ncbi:MAG: xanthine dehydrogenase family protein molybdopterin-binding subunit [Candidatus Pelagibacterales bacterium]|nr:MAG: xanthine dehydrogenase family protein molybdopterin-binding subunit [Pelagibacterales bacterium]
MASLVGSRVERKEDKRFLTGKGRYTADINIANQTYAVFVRSPHARAKIKKVDVSKALKSSGVVGILTGEEIATDKIGGLIAGWAIRSEDGTEMKVPANPPLAKDVANFVGEPIAIVIADTLDEAKSASDLVKIDYKILKAVTNTAKTMSGETIHDGIDKNLCYDWLLGDREKVKEAFSKADKIIKVDLINNRLVPNAMEPRACVVDYNTASEEITLYTTSQNPHLSRLVMSAFGGVAPENKLRVVAPDVGGGFGSKINVYNEEIVCSWASKKIERPIKWVAERTESFLTDTHGRDHVTHAELAVTNDGKFLGFKNETIANLGAYARVFGTVTPTYLFGPCATGVYEIPAAYSNVKAVYTNTAPVDAYRGAGRPEATYTIERLVEKAAMELGIDRTELRMRNFPKTFPFKQTLVHTVDSGDYVAGLEKAKQMADYNNFESRRKESEAKGKLRGIGVSSYFEACGIAPSAAVMSLGCGVGLWESAEVRFNPTGQISVFTGAHSHGQSHQTTFAQIAADELGVPIENIDVVHGDTDKGTFGMGTYGSRSLTVGGIAIVNACKKIVAKGKRVAAKMLEVSEDEIEFKDGEFVALKSNKKKTIGEIAFACYVPGQRDEMKSPIPEGDEPGLIESSFFDPANFSFPAGSHICEVEIDPETGEVKVEKYTAVDDFGRIVNPMIVEGQVHGGIAQGIGQALHENTEYDETGQLITASYMDYTMPRADNFPEFNLGFTCTHATSNPLGVKGCGEAGAIASPPTVMNAVIDALGGQEISMPATAEKVWKACKNLKKSNSKAA